MLASEFRDLGMRAWGHGYQARVARGLAVAERTVRRWASGETVISDGAAAEIVALAERAGTARTFAAECVSRYAEEADAAGLDRAEAMAALVEYAGVRAEIAACAARRTRRSTR